ncbi:transmembrane protein 132C isoform X1, partial [Tachysurus ichikawai]
MDVIVDSVGSGLISWTVEYPGIRATSDETETKIHIVQRELTGIVPLAMEVDHPSRDGAVEKQYCSSSVRIQLVLQMD